MVMVWLISFFFPLFWKADLQAFHISGYAQGTSYRITYYAEEDKVSKQQIEHLFASIDSSLSIYRPYSLVSRFNNSSSGIQMDEHLEKVVKKSLEISEKTGGTFDITVQPLVQAWGFGAEPVDKTPDSATVDSLLNCVGSEKLRLSASHLTKKVPCVRIDVNGIAQGYSVDIMAEYLDARGVKNYLVEIGGEIRIKGRKQPSGTYMSIGIESPGGNAPNPFPVRRIIQPAHGALTTSGHYRQFYQQEGKRISHLIDPGTGYPLRNEMVSVTVWAQDAMTADGYDNALIGMGVEKALTFVEQQKELEAYFIYQTAEGALADTATIGFYEMMIQ